MRSVYMRAPVLAAPNRFRVGASPLELGEAIKVLHWQLDPPACLLWSAFEKPR
jgi:hypothetical protein